MVKHRKFWILIAAAIAIVALFLLSTSLSNVKLLPGKPFPWGLFLLKSEDPLTYPAVEQSTLLITIMRTIILILLVLSALYLIFTKEGRRRGLRIVLQVLILMLLMSFVLERQLTPPREVEEGTTSESIPMEDLQVEPPPEFEVGDMRDITTTLSLILAIGLTVIILGALYILWRRRRPVQDTTLIDLARGAQDALDDIQAGGSLRNAVIRCYAEMSRVISEKRNIQRGITVTSHEFEEHLVKAGLPKAPVQELTHLFEEARYGDRNPGPAEEQRAITCLSSIVTAVAELSR